MNTDKLLEKLPDVYFDWYARFIPGIIAIVYYLYIKQPSFNASFNCIFLYAIISYLLGHVIQPASSFCVTIIQNLFHSDEKIYKIAKLTNDSPKVILKVSKVHAEAVGMLSSAFLILIVSLYYHKWPTIAIIGIIYFLLASIERIYARKKKIGDLKIST